MIKELHWSSISFFYLSPETSIPRHRPSMITKLTACLNAAEIFMLNTLSTVTCRNSIILRMSRMLNDFLYKAKYFCANTKFIYPIMLNIDRESR
jgi:hypothetical protein